MDELWETRSIFYKFLAAFCLLAPKDAFCLFPADLFEAPPLQLSGPAHAGWDLMHDYIESYNGEEIAADHELTADYYRLFVGPDTVLAPPWESVYRHEDRLIFGKETVRIRELYARYGLATRWLGKEPDDHLGLELEFLAYLSAFTKQVIDGGSREAVTTAVADQHLLIQDHLLQWVPLWQSSVTAHAQTAFYKGLAIVAESFIQADAIFIGKFLQKLEDERSSCDETR